MEETGLGLTGGTNEKHQYPSQDNNTGTRTNLAPPEHKTRPVTLQEERRLMRTKDKQSRNEGQSKCQCVRISEECSTLVGSTVLTKHSVSIKD
jgi:hypothetical protein